MPDDFSPGGVIAIVRLRQRRPDDQIRDALVAGGITAIEITLPTPGSLDAVARWRHGADAVIGVGTVRTVEDAECAIAAGARFLVTPTTMPAVLRTARAAGVPVVCGAMTPTEIDTAWQYGAAAVKVFPIGPLGGPAYLKAVAEPLDNVPFIPTGGVDVNAAQAYAALGCAGVGVGSALVSEAVAAARDWDGLTVRAAAFADAWRAGRHG